MMEQKSNIDKAVEIVAEKPEFRGYTLDEIRYRRALAAMRREYSKEKIINGMTRLRKRAVFGGKESGVVGKAGSLASKLFSGLNYIDYAMVGFTAFSAIKKVFRIFRKKK